jgi:hypothetical protein
MKQMLLLGNPKRIAVDVEKYEKVRALIIVLDITKTYFGTAEDFLFFLNYLINNKRKEVKMVFLCL